MTNLTKILDAYQRGERGMPTYAELRGIAQPAPSTEHMTGLKPCPFCGGNAVFDHDDNGWNWIVCEACQASTNALVSAMDDCKPILAEHWNRRATPTPHADQDAKPADCSSDPTSCPQNEGTGCWCYDHGVPMVKGEKIE